MVGVTQGFQVGEVVECSVIGDCDDVVDLGCWSPAAHAPASVHCQSSLACFLPLRSVDEECVLAGLSPRLRLVLLATSAVDGHVSAPRPGASGPRSERHRSTYSRIYACGMGFKDWVADAPLGMFAGSDGSFTLRKDRIEHKAGFKTETVPLSEVTGVHLESGSELESRITATRLVALGVFALAVKKKKGGEKFLTIEGPETYWVVEVPRKKISEAMKFVGKVEGQRRVVGD